jgi:hypothetical protein
MKRDAVGQAAMLAATGPPDELELTRLREMINSGRWSVVRREHNLYTLQFLAQEWLWQLAVCSLPSFCGSLCGCLMVATGTCHVW